MSKILFSLSGSIACFKSAALISKLAQNGHEVQTVATAAALKFIGEATLEGLTGKPVLSEVFARGEYMQHIHLVKWADLMILAPASANTINKFAAGLGDDLVSTLFLAHDFTKPFLIAPAMNSSMYAHPSTQASLTRLRSWPNVNLLEPAAGNLACGDVGHGRLLEPDEILAAVESALSARAESISELAIDRETAAPRLSSEAKMAVTSGAGSTNASTTSKKILITSGGTREAIDGVRTITNMSTGRTGAAIATALAKHGHHVTLLRAQDSATPFSAAPANAVAADTFANRINMKPYVSFNDLDTLLQQELKSENFDAVLHIAAVSDYSVDYLEVGGEKFDSQTDLKIDSQNDMTIHLKRNFKIVDRLRSYSKNPLMLVIAFKLTKGLDADEVTKKVERLLQSSQADFVVQNDLNEVAPAQSPNDHHAKIFDAKLKLNFETNSKQELAQTLEKIIRERRIENDSLS